METTNNCDFCHSSMFRRSYGSTSQARLMPRGGQGIIDFTIVNPYTGTTTPKFGTTSFTNNTNISKAMRYSQYVNTPNRDGKNTQTYSYNEYVAKFGPLPNQTIDKSCYNTPAFKPQVLFTNTQKIAPGQQFMFQTNY
jgi:hypothetical protein